MNNKQNQIELRIDNINNTSFNSSIKQPDDFNLSSNQLNNIKKNVEDLKGKIKEIENNNNNNNLISSQKLSQLENTVKTHINNDYSKLNNDLKNLQNEFLKYQRLDIDELSKLNFDNLKNLNYYELNNLKFQELKEIPKLKSEIDNLKKSNEIINNQLTSIQNQLALLGNQRNDNLDLNNLLSSKINVQPQLDERTIENLKKIDLEKLSKLNLDSLLSLNIESLSKIDLEKLEELIRKAERTQDENQKLFSMFTKYNKKLSLMEQDFENRESNLRESFDNKVEKSLGDNGIGHLRSEINKLSTQIENMKNNDFVSKNDFDNLKNEIEQLKKNNNNNEGNNKTVHFQIDKNEDKYDILDDVNKSRSELRKSRIDDELYESGIEKDDEKKDDDNDLFNNERKQNSEIQDNNNLIELEENNNQKLENDNNEFDIVNENENKNNQKKENEGIDDFDIEEIVDE